MRVLLTGSTGLLGRRVTQALLQQEMDVRCLIHTPGREEVLGDAPVEVYYGDVVDCAALRASMYHVDAVVHLAAIIRESWRGNFESVNVEGTRNVLAVSRERGVAHFVYVSTIGVCNNPRYPFLRSRWLAEQEVLRSGLPYTILRPSVLFGEGDEFINVLAALVRIFPLVPVPGWGKAMFQPIAVEETARCIATTVGNEAFLGETVEVGGPEHLQYRQMVEVVASMWGLRRQWCPTPMFLMRPVVKCMEAVFPRFPVTMGQLDMLCVDNTTDQDAVEKVFGFRPKRLQEGVQYVRRIGYWDAWKIFLGMTPQHIRAH